MERDKYEKILHSSLSRRRLLGFGAAATGVVILNACGGSRKALVSNLDCQRLLGDHELRIGPQPIETPSQVEIQPDQILSDKELEVIGVKVFNFSEFPGEIKFTEGFKPFLKPLIERGARLRIIFVDDSPNKEELQKSPLDQLAFFTDEEIFSYRNLINKKRPNTIQSIKEGTPIIALPKEFQTGCQPQTINLTFIDTDADRGGFAEVYYKPRPGFLDELEQRLKEDGDTSKLVNDPESYIPLITVVIGVKDIQRGYEDLQLNNYRTIPIEDAQRESLMNRFFHEIKHAQDSAGYVNELDSRFFEDFNGRLPHDERPGKKRAIEFAEEEIKKIRDGKLPAIVIYDDKGKMLKINISSTAA